MPERMTWQVHAIEATEDQEAMMDLGDWEPFAVTSDDYVLLKRQTIIEDEKSSVHHELTFAQRYDNPPDMDPAED